MSEIKSFPFNGEDTLIKTRHSFYGNQSPNDSVKSKSETYSAPDINIIRMKDFPSIIDSGCVNRQGLSVKEESSEEYYKNYEHDEVPVKDNSIYSTNSDLLESDVSSDAKELTNSDLDKIEIRVFKNMSKELQTFPKTHDHNVKLFKTTVQEILDKFYTNVHDCEFYKKKLNEILSKNKENLVDEMEDFIKDIIEHIICSESYVSSERNENELSSLSDSRIKDASGDESRVFSHDTGKCQCSKQKAIEEYRNENYLTDSTFDEEAFKMNLNEEKDNTCNVYVFHKNPCVEIKMNGRNLLSEINIRNQYPEELDQIASADNVRSVTAKRLQMTKYMKEAECQSNDKIIPVKLSYAKKNIQAEENSEDLNETNKSFIYKICNFLCKKLRKTSLG